jgi:pimeloyl-ACP methyl ester carboxylesterase
VVCIHGAFISDAFEPLASEPALKEQHRVITYHRRGYDGSGVIVRATLGEQADDCRQLLARLGLERAHIVGHSFGGAVALQLAVETPEIVQTLTVIEPGFAIGETGDAYRLALAQSVERYREVGARVAADEFLEWRWPGYRDRLEAALPGAFDRAVANAPTCFESELPAVIESQFGEADAKRITKPTLVVLGGNSVALDPRFAETHRLLLQWLPNAEGVVIPEAAHLLHVEAPQALAETLADFFFRRSAADTRARS